MSVLQVTNLIKTFAQGMWPFTKTEQHAVVNDISFQLQKGEILGLLGPNGAGKTTTISLLLGTLTPSGGSICYFGREFAADRIEILKRIGSASGYDKLPARLTVIENLDIVGRMYGLEHSVRTQQIEALLKHFDLWNMRNRDTGTLSAGQSTRVMLAKAFIVNPEIVLLDEPTASLDPDIAQEIRQFILTQRSTYGTSILITSHNMDEVPQLCDRVLVMKHGCIIANNTPAQLAQLTARVRIHLTITTDLEQAVTYFKEFQALYTVQAPHQVTIEIDEQDVAACLTQLSQRNILYSQISIDKPTLEDYFLSIAK